MPASVPDAAVMAQPSLESPGHDLFHTVGSSRVTDHDCVKASMFGRYDATGHESAIDHVRFDVDPMQSKGRR